MAKDVRERMIDGAALLLAKQGPQATSFSDVIALTGAPRGSIYHHFPEGKDQLLDAALDVAGGRASRLLDQWVGLSPAALAANFLDIWRTILVRSSYGAGCAIVAVTVSTDSPVLLDHAAEIFRDWRARLGAIFEAGGMPNAAQFAALLVAASEGAVVISRAERSMEPFELVAAELLARLAV